MRNAKSAELFRSYADKSDGKFFYVLIKKALMI